MREWSRFSFSAAVLAVTQLASTTAGFAADEPAGTLTSLSGLVQIRHGANLRAGSVNEGVYAGDTISTGEIASAKLLFSDDSVIDLGPKSSFKVDAFQSKGTGDRTALFTVLYGRFRALVTKAISSESKFEVKTRDAVMGVRGTEFVVNSPAVGGTQLKTELTVMHGNVAVSLPKINLPPVSVGANSQLVAAAGMTSVPRPVAIPVAEAQLIERQARVVDNTFTRTVSLDSGIRNEKAPAAATPVAIAHTSAQAASASVSSEKSDSGNLKATGAFSVLDTLSIAPAVLIPGNFQTVTVHLTH